MLNFGGPSNADFQESVWVSCVFYAYRTYLIDEQFQGKTAQLAAANVSNRVNLHVNLRFYQINFWGRSHNSQRSKKICENDRVLFGIDFRPTK